MHELNKTIISGSSDEKIKFWSIKTGKCYKTLVGHTDPINCLEVINDKLFSGSRDYSIKIWNLKNVINLHTNYNRHISLLDTYSNHEGFVTSVKLLFENTLASSSWDGKIKIWNMQSGDCIYTIEAHRSFVTCLEVSCPSSSSKQLVSGSYDGSIKIWNSQTNECLKTIGRSNDNSYVHCIRINQFSNYVISGSHDKSVRIFNLETGQLIKEFKNIHSSWISCIEFLSNDVLLTGSADNTIKLINLKSGKIISTLKGHTNFVECIAVVSEDTIISGSTDKTIKLWNINKNENIFTFTGHSNSVNCIQVV